jgi:hypothetical protein
MRSSHTHILLDALDRPIKLIFWTLPQWCTILAPLLMGILMDHPVGIIITAINLGFLNRLPYLDKPRLLMALRYRFLPADRKLSVLPLAEQEIYPK